VREWLVTEKLSVSELQGIVESAAQLTFEIYGDPRKGPIRANDYYVPPPDYTEELINLLRRTIDLYNVLPLILPTFDAFIIEGALLNRKPMTDALMRGTTVVQADGAKRWLKSFALFLISRQPSLQAWSGWSHLSFSETKIETVVKKADRLFEA
jgi:hypothetical protein